MMLLFVVSLYGSTVPIPAEEIVEFQDEDSNVVDKLAGLRDQFG
jgi:hypothetical protein